MPATPTPLPDLAPRALADLGPVLCLHAAGDPHPLAGWARARRVAARVRLDSEGPDEALCFFDADGRCCWRLHVLPDSDFLAWSRLLEALPRDADGDQAPAWFERCRRAVRPRWRACALRLHAIPDTRGALRLAAADVDLSPLGEDWARRVARGA